MADDLNELRVNNKTDQSWTE